MAGVAGGSRQGPHALTALGRGLTNRCPHCGIGKIYTGWATEVKTCPHCGLVYEPTEGDTAVVDRITAGLLRLHAERMQVIAREQRTRDRFTSLHPEVAVAEVAALPGDVHDLAGLRVIGDRLTAGRTPSA